MPDETTLTRDMADALWRLMATCRDMELQSNSHDPVELIGRLKRMVREGLARLPADTETVLMRVAGEVPCAGCQRPIPPGHARVGGLDGREWHGACAPHRLPE